MVGDADGNAIKVGGPGGFTVFGGTVAAGGFTVFGGTVAAGVITVFGGTVAEGGVVGTTSPFGSRVAVVELSSLESVRAGSLGDDDCETLGSIASTKITVSV
jgi:hypothetical protein